MRPIIYATATITVAVIILLTGCGRNQSMLSKVIDTTDASTPTDNAGVNTGEPKTDKIVSWTEGEGRAATEYTIYAFATVGNVLKSDKFTSDLQNATKWNLENCGKTEKWGFTGFDGVYSFFEKETAVLFAKEIQDNKEFNQELGLSEIYFTYRDDLSFEENYVEKPPFIEGIYIVRILPFCW